MAENRWQDIYLHLKKEGFEVYSPGIKLGECASNYVVVKYNGSSRLGDYSTDDDYYSIMCYVPKFEYSKLESFVQEVKASMSKLKPMIMPMGIQSESFYDDSIKAHMVSIEYKNHKRIL